ncbi:heme ABC transporter permease CcmC [soil metagenome]
MHQLLAPKNFYLWCGRWLRPVAWATGFCTLTGLYWGLVVAPPDYQQGDSYRIMFVHVPSAWMSLFVYAVVAGAGAVALVWRIKIAEVVASASAPIGAAFTALALMTGSLWGKPMWGTWWVWDARLTSELLLLFLYLGYMALEEAIEDRRTATRAAAVLALVGAVDLPIIHYSVEWWHTLHQAPTITRFGAPAIHGSMLAPLLVMAFAFFGYYVSMLLMRARCELLERERTNPWVSDVLRAIP